MVKGTVQEFTYENQLTGYRQYYSVCENSCILSSLAKEELSTACGNNHVDVIKVILAILGDCHFLTERALQPRAVEFERRAFIRQAVSNERCYQAAGHCSTLRNKSQDISASVASISTSFPKSQI